MKIIPIGINYCSTGATVQRTDRPPSDCLSLTKILLKYYQLFYYSGEKHLIR
ncbi:MAG: hypothetical protein LBK82_04490 [Planctomycetaceae bacterium]|nr:hypothetical protein [Planctomycetaceae bacterium]